ncbi:MAG: hypothetical protein MZU95_15635 [Desulfomicrobium escambiense]|nr:hypothetical protein [Desulfomicrobium escambiense]
MDAVSAFVGRIGRALVNVIPYNPGRAPIGRAPGKRRSRLSWKAWPPGAYPCGAGSRRAGHSGPPAASLEA